MYFPKRLELSFRTVLAFPKDSSRGAASSIYQAFKHNKSTTFISTVESIVTLLLLQELQQTFYHQCSQSTVLSQARPS